MWESSDRDPNYGDVNVGKSTLIEKLSLLEKLNGEAASAYGQAIECIEEADIRRQLSAFRLDHDRHVTRLALLIARLGSGSSCPKRKVSIALKELTSVEAGVDTKLALISLLENADLLMRRYQE